MDKLKLLRAEIGAAWNDQPYLLLRKQVYPIEYMNSWVRFIERRVPSKDAFYNKLRGQAISDEEYAHAQNVLSTRE